MRYVACLALAAALGSAGCATTGKSSFRMDPPVPVQVDNEVYLDEDFEVVWNRLIKNLATSFFVVNNIDKSSRFINVSFSTQTPEDYIDCGRTHRTYIRGGDSNQYDYPIAGSTYYKVGGKWGPLNNLPVTWDIQRTTQLDGRINIYIAPQDSGTVVTANCKYVLRTTIDGIETRENAFGTVVARQALPQRSFVIEFTTGQTGTYRSVGEGQSSEIECVGLGRLERDILALLEDD